MTRVDLEPLECRLLMSVIMTATRVRLFGDGPGVGPPPILTTRGTFDATMYDGDYSVRIVRSSNQTVELSWTSKFGTASDHYQANAIKRIVIRGGPGSDNIYIDPRLTYRTTITGGGGNDTIVGGSRADLIDAGAGNDRINAGAGNDSVTGGAGNDRINAEDGYDFVDGGSGRDIITGGAGEDTLLGGGGNDHLDGGRATDLLRGGTGDDTFATIDTFGNHDAIFGERGIDQLTRMDADDVFDAGSQIAG